MRWSGPVLTDSGGFQVFSLGHMRRLTDEGVTFRSHIDGSEHFLSPELAVEYQRGLGSDIAMVLDHCPAYGESDEEVRQATERTSRWAKRCLDASTDDGPALFGIVQGGWSEQLRRSSAEHLASLGFQGYAVGGVSVGEPKALSLPGRRAIGTLPAPGQTKVPDGGRLPRGPGDLHRHGDRSVRLRPSNQGRPERRNVHQEWTDQHPERRFRADNWTRSTRKWTATRPSSRPATCITSSSPGSYCFTGSRPSITFGSFCG